MFYRHREPKAVVQFISGMFPTFNADVGLDDSQHCIDDQHYLYTVLNMMKTVLFKRYRELIIEESNSDVFPTFNADVGLDDSQHCIDDQRVGDHRVQRFVRWDSCRLAHTLAKNLKKKLDPVALLLSPGPYPREEPSTRS